MATEFLQFQTKGSCYFFPSHCDPNLFVWKGASYKLPGAVCCLQSLVCKPIHLIVDLLLQCTISPFLCFICVWLHILQFDRERLNRGKVFEHAEDISLGLVGWEGPKGCIAMWHDPIVIIIHNNRRDTVFTWRRGSIKDHLCHYPTKNFLAVWPRRCWTLGPSAFALVSSDQAIYHCCCGADVRWDFLHVWPIMNDYQGLCQHAVEYPRSISIVVERNPQWLIGKMPNCLLKSRNGWGGNVHWYSRM